MDALWDAYHADRSIANRNALIEAYLPMVQRMAIKLWITIPRNAGQKVGDLVGYAIRGLIHCIEKFDPDRGLKFATYAGRRIGGAMRDGLRDEDWVPRLERAAEKRGEVEPVATFNIGGVTTERDDGSKEWNGSRDDLFDPPDRQTP